MNTAVRLQAKRVRQELGRLRTTLVVKADREFGEGEERAIYVDRWVGYPRRLSGYTSIMKVRLFRNQRTVFAGKRWETDAEMRQRIVEFQRLGKPTPEKRQVIDMVPGDYRELLMMTGGDQSPKVTGTIWEISVADSRSRIVDWTGRVLDEDEAEAIRAVAEYLS